MGNLNIRTRIENGITYWRVSDIENNLTINNLKYSISNSGITLKQFVENEKRSRNYIDEENLQKLIEHMKHAAKSSKQALQLEQLYYFLINKPSEYDAIVEDLPPENQLQTFNNAEFGALGILIIDEKPYFPAIECAEILGYERPHNAVSRHCPTP